MIIQKINKILRLVEGNLKTLNLNKTEKLIEELERAKRIFIVGVGRSGLVGRAFGMRLMHLGFSVFIVGDTITPAIKEGDLLLAISGSGETQLVKSCLKIARKNKSKTIAVTGNTKSSAARNSDLVIKISNSVSPKSKEDYLVRQLAGEDIKHYAPLGTLFELSTLVFLEGLIALLIERKKIDEKKMRAQHANLE